MCTSFGGWLRERERELCKKRCFLSLLWKSGVMTSVFHPSSSSSDLIKTFQLFFSPNGLQNYNTMTSMRRKKKYQKSHKSKRSETKRNWVRCNKWNQVLVLLKCFDGALQDGAPKCCCCYCFIVDRLELVDKNHFGEIKFMLENESDRKKFPTQKDTTIKHNRNRTKPSRPEPTYGNSARMIYHAGAGRLHLNTHIFLFHRAVLFTS